MLCQTVLPKICGYYLSASIINLGANTNVGENSCNSGDGTDQTGPILGVYDDDDDDQYY